MNAGRRLPPGGCSWCAHGPHDDECPHESCPCAYRVTRGDGLGSERTSGTLETPRGASAGNRHHASGLPHHLTETGGLA